MRLKRFRRYRDYIAAQKETAEKHSKGPYFNEIEIENVCRYLITHKHYPALGICHGARHGVECDQFKRYFPSMDMFGTDLFPFMGECRVPKEEFGSNVIQWDFMAREPRWVGKFDLLYSNALDHARWPQEALKIWFEQLSPSGYLVLQWSPGHLQVKGGDCFAATIYEYIDMCNGIGRVVDLIYTKVPKIMHLPLRRRAWETIEIICRKKEPK